MPLPGHCETVVRIHLKRESLGLLRVASDELWNDPQLNMVIGSLQVSHPHDLLCSSTGTLHILLLHFIQGLIQVIQGHT